MTFLFLINLENGSFSLRLFKYPLSEHLQKSERIHFDEDRSGDLKFCKQIKYKIEKNILVSCQKEN